jgi:hypothetical protein
MKIDCIFDENLFAFHYENESKNELDCLLDEWNDIEYLDTFYNENKRQIENNTYLRINNEDEFIDIVIDNAQNIDEILEKLSNNNDLDSFFEMLNINQNMFEILSKRKGRQNLLRIYAIKIDSNCYVITGGAIKITETMQGHQDTLLELPKLEKCKQYLKENDVFDSDSFYELVNDN